MTTLRILVITNMYPPHHLGGYELSCRDVVERWRAVGHHVEVLTTTMRVPEVADPPGERGSGVRRDLEFYWSDYSRLTPSLRARLRIERANQVALSRVLDEVRPDVVSAWHMGAMSLGLLQTVTERNVPMVLVVCDDWLNYGPVADMWMKLFASRPRLGSLARRVFGVPTSVSLDPDRVAICFVSDWIRRRSSEQSTFPLGRSTVVYSGIDRSDFPDSPDPDRPWSWTLLTVGRVEARKGVHVALGALRHLPQEATLHVVGPAHERYLQRLHATAAEFGVEEQIRFVGPLARPELRGYFRSADVLVFPVLWDEPFGLVPLEAMACDTPVVATGTGGSGEFLVDGMNALLVPPGDETSLAEAIHRLEANPELRGTLVRAGRATVGQLGVDQLAEVLESWHQSAAVGFQDGVPPDRSPIGGRIRELTGREAGRADSENERK